MYYDFLNILLNTNTDKLISILYKIISVNTKSVDQFYQQYANGVLAVCGIKPNYCAKVFMYLCMKSNNNKIVVDKFMRNEIIKHCKINFSAITKALDTLYSNGIINRICRGKYRINERYAWSCTSADRAEILKGAKIDVRISIMPNEEIFNIDN